MKIERQLLKGTAPLAVLALLAERPMYGYEISKELTWRSKDLLSLGHGSLYPLLYNLEAKGHVQAKEECAENGRPRRYYHITQSGTKHLTQQRQHWEQLQQGMHNLLQSSPQELHS